MKGYIKKGFYILALIFGLNTTVLAAGSIPTTKPYFGGAYVGIAGGLSTTSPKLSSDSKIDVWTDSTKTTKLVEISGHHDHENYVKHSFNGSIFAGYGKTLKGSFYVGAEILANYFNTTIQDSYTYSITPINQGANYNPQGKFKVDNKWSLGGALRLGYLLTPRAMIYALIGFDYSKFKVKDTMSNHYVDSNIDKNFTITNQFSKCLPGFDPGLGVEMAVSDHLSVRLQYIFTFYDSYEHTATKQDTVPWKKFSTISLPYEISMNTKLNPSRGTVQLMLSYLFN